MTKLLHTIEPLGQGWPLDAFPPLELEARGAIERWLDLVATWNRRVDLVSARSAEELVDIMLADALVLTQKIPFGARVVDVGSGAGAPGLAVALLRRDLAVTLVEPLNKRVSFLRTVLGTLGRDDVRLERARGEDLARRGESWQVALSRATLAPAEWLELGTRLAGKRGSVWVLLARDEPPSRAGWRVADEVRYEWPHASAPRRAVRYAKVVSDETPAS
jgi:16S rRNA (guanine527-N7)-methyltransferase